jgi:putative N-acetyltransferase (TIGR04045 family)
MSGPTSRLSAPAEALAPQLACRPVASAAELAEHFRIRHQVFVAEQGLFGAGGNGQAAGSDHDGHDDDPATIHVVGLAGDVICGTVRLYPLASPHGQWKGDRLAVAPGYRRHGLGAPLVRFAVAAAGARGGHQMEAFIQPANVTFFERLGWRRTGPPVIYAGIDHCRMVIALSAGPLSAGPLSAGRLSPGR